MTTDRLIHFPAFRCLVFLVLVSMMAGCRIPHRVKLTKTGAPKYKRVNIVYDLSRPYHALATSQQQTFFEIQPVSSSDASSIEVQDDIWTKARLTIEFPHPTGNPELARATLRLVRIDPRAPIPDPTMIHRLQSRTHRLLPIIVAEPKELSETIREDVRVMDFPRQQLDLLVLGLSHSGFFDRQSRPDGEARLKVRINLNHVSKVWTPEPRLDDFIDRVYREGVQINRSGFATVSLMEPIELIDFPAEETDRTQRRFAIDDQ